MRVIVRDHGYTGSVAVFFIEESFQGDRIINVDSITDEGTIIWRSSELSERTAAPAPTLVLTAEMLFKLKQALRDTKVVIDDELIHRLRLEEGRVEKLLDHLLKERTGE